MHTTTPYAYDKSMDEILQSIRQTITEDLGTVTQLQDNHLSSSAEDVLELTQIVQDDGTIIDLREEKPTMPKQPQDNIDALFDSPAAPAEGPTPAAEALESAGASEKASSADIDALFDTPPAAEPAPSENLQPESEPEPAIEMVAESVAPEMPVPDASLTNEPMTSVTPEPAPEIFGEQIIEDKTIQASLDALSSIGSFASSSSFAGGLYDGNQQTIESLVRELLRPEIKKWLDANLPSLVKWIVTEQIERIFKEANKK